MSEPTPIKITPEDARDLLDREIAALEDRQCEIRTRLDELVDRHPELKSEGRS